MVTAAASSCGCSSGRKCPPLTCCIAVVRTRADAGQRRREYQRPDQIRALSSHGLGNQAADVVSAKDRSVQPEFLDQPDDAARRRGGAERPESSLRVVSVFAGQGNDLNWQAILCRCRLVA